MRIAVPAADDSGMDADISKHFGRSPYFTIWDTETEEAEIIGNMNPHHGPGASEGHGQGHEHHHGHGFAFQTLSTMKIDVLACRGLGMRALQLFEAPLQPQRPRRLRLAHPGGELRGLRVPGAHAPR